MTEEKRKVSLSELLKKGGLRCPECNCAESFVTHSVGVLGRRRRRRECRNCGHRWTTFEK